jgi:diadenylate cyclase
MPNFLEWNTLGWRDAVDVVVVAVVLYYILLAIRGTRAVPILYGIVMLLGVQALSFFLKLQSTYFVIRGLVLSIVVALPIVFQPELRRALMQLGGSLKAPFHHVRQDVLDRIVDEIARAVTILSQARIGALIVVERETGLEEYVENGVRVNAEVSSKLLMSVFQKTSPLHDGAVIIRGDKVVAAACYLPLSDVRLAASNVHSGTRHRAALGLSEQTDAVIVVVSEETGDISVADSGTFVITKGEDALKMRLRDILTPGGGGGTQALSLRSMGVRIDALMPWRRTRPEAPQPIPTAVVESLPAEPPPPRPVPSESLDEERIAEKQRQTEKAVDVRATEKKLREERRKDDELRKPEGEENEPAPTVPRAPTAGRAAPLPPRTGDLQGRQ